MSDSQPTPRLPPDRVELVDRTLGVPRPEQQEAVLLTDLEVLRVVLDDPLGHLARRGLEIPVIILTGHGHEEDRQLCMELGAFAYLQKPLDINVLSETIQKANEKGVWEGGIHSIQIHSTETDQRMVRQANKFHVWTAGIEKGEKILALINESEYNITDLQVVLAEFSLLKQE